MQKRHRNTYPPDPCRLLQYHAIEKADHRHSNRTISLEGLAELSFAVLSAETEVMDQYDQEERARLCRLLTEGLDACLTAPQRRRLWLYCVEGLTIKEIAAQEKVKHQNISKSVEGLTIKEIAAQEKVKHQNISKRILAAKKILKKFLERWVQNGTKNGDK